MCATFYERNKAATNYFMKYLDKVAGGGITASKLFVVNHEGVGTYCHQLT
jgi:hypothetical protein